jgi:hypothetical protein
MQAASSAGVDAPHAASDTAANSARARTMDGS